jgi:hypothetical protein
VIEKEGFVIALMVGVESLVLQCLGFSVNSAAEICQAADFQMFTRIPVSNLQKN